MAPGVVWIMDATPALPSAGRLPAGQWIIESEPSFQTCGADSTRNLVKFCVVPEESDRRTITICVPGSLIPGFSAAIAGSFHFVMVPWKIPAMTGPDSCSLPTVGRLYAMAIGPITTGKYRTVLPLKPASSEAGIGAVSDPAKLTMPAARLA